MHSSDGSFEVGTQFLRFDLLYKALLPVFGSYKVKIGERDSGD